MAIIIPFTLLWWAWNILLAAAITVNAVLVTFGIGFDRDFATHPLLIAAFVVHLFDIPIRMRTGVLNDQTISTDMDAVLKQYLERWLLLDILATFPYEYFLTFSGNYGAARWFMLLKLLKMGRLHETIQIFRQNARSSYSMYAFFVSLFMLYFFLLHF